MGRPDHYGDFVLLAPQIKIVAPTLNIHAVPPSYGEVKGANTLAFIDQIRERSIAIIESVNVEGSHHLHMTKAKQTAEIILNFLNKIRNLDPVVSKL